MNFDFIFGALGAIAGLVTIFLAIGRKSYSMFFIFPKVIEEEVFMSHSMRLFRKVFAIFFISLLLSIYFIGIHIYNVESHEFYFIDLSYISFVYSWYSIIVLLVILAIITIIRSIKRVRDTYFRVSRNIIKRNKKYKNIPYVVPFVFVFIYSIILSMNYGMFINVLLNDIRILLKLEEINSTIAILLHIGLFKWEYIVVLSITIVLYTVLFFYAVNFLTLISKNSTVANIKLKSGVSYNHVFIFHSNLDNSILIGDSYENWSNKILIPKENIEEIVFGTHSVRFGEEKIYIKNWTHRKKILSTLDDI